MKRVLWLPLTVIMLIPVPVVLFSHHSVPGSSVNGELLTGISALDSVLALSSGKPVLLNFWATWCGPCVRELPELEELAASLGDGAVVLAVDMGDPELSTLETFLRNDPVGLTVIWLSTVEAAEVSERFDLPDVLPVSLILDVRGMEVQRASGARSGDWFRASMAGASGEDVVLPGELHSVHIYVVGPVDDPATLELIAAAVDIAGDTGYEILDPTIPSDSVLMEEAYLPMNGWPYAQLCVGGACSSPVLTVPALYSAYEGMR